jgi:hypothetical protein
MRRVLVVLLILAAYAFGAFSHQNEIFPTPQIEAGVRRYLWHFREERGFKNTTGRSEVDCGQFVRAGSAILLTLGQSNAANESEPGFQPGAGVYNFNFFDGKCYVARDPLLGATGAEGSVWSRLGDELVRSGRFERVLIAPIAVGGSRVRAWTPSGAHFSRIIAVQKALASRGLAATHVLWHQGESDARWTTQQQYLDMFGQMLDGMRGEGVDAPVYVAVASACGHGGSDAVRAAQREIPNRFANTHPGPNTDEIDRLRWRRDGCHFSAEGLELHAKAWAEALGD